MAHVAKFGRGAMGHMLSHYDRTKEGLGENVNPERTHLNYNLAQTDQPKKQLDFIHQRLAEVKCQNRKDVNVFCDWVVTAPKDLPEEEQSSFFSACYDFLADRYGKKNIVSAYVHMDETTPHMHFAFMPVVPDRKHPGREKISAKEVITRSDLQTFHQDLRRHLERELGHEVGILNEATREGNKSIAELRRQSATERLQEATAEASQIVSEARKEVEVVKSTLIPLRAEYEARRAFLDEADKASRISEMYPDTAKITRKGLLHKKEFVTVPAEVWEAKHVSANEKKFVKQAEEALDVRIGEFYSSATGEQIEKLNQEIRALESQVRSLQNQNRELSEKEERLIKKINRVLARLPAELSERFVDEWRRQDRQQQRDLSL